MFVVGSVVALSQHFFSMFSTFSPFMFSAKLLVYVTTQFLPCSFLCRDKQFLCCDIALSLQLCFMLRHKFGVSRHKFQVSQHTFNSFCSNCVATKFENVATFCSSLIEALFTLFRDMAAFSCCLPHNLCHDKAMECRDITFTVLQAFSSINVTT